MGEFRVFIRENDLGKIRKLISDSENDITEDEIRGTITILNTISRLAMKGFLIH